MTKETKNFHGYQPDDEIDTSNPPKGTPPTEDWKDKYVRLYADFENYKKRSVFDLENAINQNTVKTINPVLDLHNELRIAYEMTKDKAAKKALNMFISKFENYLEKNGIEEVQTKEFNPNLHEVISVIDNEKDIEPRILNVVSNGYKMDDAVIRYPKIILSRKKNV